MAHRDSGRGGRGGGRFCSHCETLGHTRDYCYSLHPELRRNRATKVTATNPATALFRTLTEEYSQFKSLLSGVSPPSSQTPITTMVRDKGNTCLVSTAFKFRKWIIDSDASDHMTGESGIFTSLSSSHNCSPVVLADGSTSTVEGIDSTSSTSSLSLSSVLFMLAFPFNLLYVNKLVHSLNCSVTFTPSGCILQDLETKKLIGTGHEFGGEIMESTHQAKERENHDSNGTQSPSKGATMSTKQEEEALKAAYERLRMEEEERIEEKTKGEIMESTHRSKERENHDSNGTQSASKGATMSTKQEEEALKAAYERLRMEEEERIEEKTKAKAKTLAADLTTRFC